MLNLTRKFLACLPVMGPHKDIACELTLAGIKPITWFPVFDDNTQFYDEQTAKEHQDRIALDKATAEGKLLSEDVEANGMIFRHYCQPSEKENMEKIIAFNKAAFNGEPCPELDKDIGLYIGFRKRDIWLWNMQDYTPQKLLQNHIPERLNKFFNQMSTICANAHRRELLERNNITFRGYPKIEPEDNTPA